MSGSEGWPAGTSSVGIASLSELTLPYHVPLTSRPLPLTSPHTPHTPHLTPYSPLHTPHLTPHTSPHPTLLTSHPTLHLTPHTPHLIPHTLHLTPHTLHLTPHTLHLTPTLPTSQPTGLASHPTLPPHTPHSHLPFYCNRYIEIKIMDGKVGGVKCPGSGCEKVIPTVSSSGTRSRSGGAELLVPEVEGWGESLPVWRGGVSSLRSL